MLNPERILQRRAQKNVCRLEVAMQQVARVEEVQCIGDARAQMQS